MVTVQLYISYLGHIVSMSIILIVLCLFLYIQGYRKQINILVGSICLSMCVTFTLKYLFDVPRPLKSLVLETGGRFPSGHATMAAVVMSLGIYYAHGRRWIQILSILWFVLIAYSRVYLRVHEVIDVVAGGIIGVVSTIIIIKVFQHLRYYKS